MKAIIVLACIFSIAFCRAEREDAYDYTGSTPAAATIRSFLGISLSDSIDFIRWQLTLRGNRYQLNCNYGIGKPNTSGFINGGKHVKLDGPIEKEENRLLLNNAGKMLTIVELNENLLHLLDGNNNLLVGNAGWSYTLNSTNPAIVDNVNVTAKQGTAKDSLIFEGRTPCKVPGIVRNGIDCYKLKWHIVFKTDASQNNTGRYKVIGTPWRIEGGRDGKWEIGTGENGRVIYRLKDENGNSFLNLLKLDENILVFTDEQGRLLVGNQDFSYTLNRIF